MSTVGQAAGGLVGGIVGFFTPVGPVIGAQIGMMVGGYLDPPKIKGNHPQVDLTVQTSTYGAPLTSGDGCYATYGNLFWLEGNQLRLETGNDGGGKGGGSKPTPDEVYGTFAIGFGEGEISAFGRIWCNGNLVYDPTAGTIGAKMANGDVSGYLSMYLGSASQLPDDRIQADMGATHAPAYRGLHYIVFKDWPMADYGNTLMGMQVKAEILNSATVTQYEQLLYDDEVLPDTNTYPGAVSTEYGYFNPRVENGVFMCDKASTANDYAYTFGISYEGTLLYRRAGGETTGEFGYIGAIAAGAVVYTGAETGTFTVGGVDFKLKTADANNTCHGMAVGADGRLYALERSAGTYLFNIYDGSTLDLISSGANISIPLGDNHISIPCIPGTNVTFCVEADGTHLWTAQEGGGEWNFMLCTISATGDLTTTHSFPDSYLGDYARFAALAAVNGICYGVNDHGGFFVYDRNRTMSPTPVPLADIIERRCLLSGLLDLGDLDTSEITQEVRGYRVTSVASIRASLEPLQGAWPFDIVPHGYQIKFKPRGGSSVAALDIGELGAVSGNDKAADILTQSREMDSQLPVQLQVTYIDVNREYDKGTGPGARRSGSDAVNVQNLDLPIVLAADEAAGIEETLLYLYWLERIDFSFTLPPPRLNLEVADVVTLDDVAATYELRLTEINYLPDGRLECSAKLNNPAIYEWTAKGQEGQSTGQVLTYPGASLVSLLDIPCVDSSIMDRAGILAAVTGYTSSWSGGTLYRSDDNGHTWNGVQGFNPPGCTMGYVENSIGSGATNIIDAANILSVRLLSGSLSSVTQAAMFNGSNHFAYGVHGRWEIIAAQNCVQQADDTYLLSNLMRGRFGTESAMTSHASGDGIVLLDQTQVRFIGMDVAAINMARLWRPVTRGKTIDGVSDVEFSYSGENLECLSPVYLNGNRHPSSLDWSISWTRRTRLAVEPFSGISAPLGEASEAYEVEIWNSDYTTLKRTITGLSSASATYTSVQQISDFGTNQATLYVKVYQISATVGRGHPLIASINRYMSLDPYLAFRVFGMHFNGTNGSTTFTEWAGKTFTASGNAQLTTTGQKYGTACGLFDGNGDYISMASANSAFDPASSDYMFGGWIYPTSLAQALQGVATTSNGSTTGWILNVSSSGALTLVFYTASGTYNYIQSTTGVIAANTWTYVLWSRSGTTYRLFAGSGATAVKVAESTVSGTINSPGPFNMGRWDHAGTTGRDFVGKMDDFTAYKGGPVYTADFATPTIEFPDT